MTNTETGRVTVTRALTKEECLLADAIDQAIRQPVTTPYTVDERALESFYGAFLRYLDGLVGDEGTQDFIGRQLDCLVDLARQAERAAVAQEQQEAS